MYVASKYEFEYLLCYFIRLKKLTKLRYTHTAHVSLTNIYVKQIAGKCKPIFGYDRKEGNVYLELDR